MHCPDQEFGLAIIGGGPAGLAPLLAAHREGQLDRLLGSGVAVIEQSDRLGAGQIGQYGINSDSSGRTFVDCLDAAGDTELTRLRTHTLTRRLAAAGDGTVALSEAGAFLALVGDALGRMIARSPASRAITRTRAISARRISQGWRLLLQDADSGEALSVRARHVVIATGATQPASRLAAETVGGVNLAARVGDRLLQSGDVLMAGGPDLVASRLSGRIAPRVAIIGGSTSAASVAHALLHRLPAISFGAGGVSLLHRRPLRIYYTDRQAALDENYTEWTEDDICPISRRVFRFAGFRLESRELVMQARGIGGRPPEPRLHLHQLQPGHDPAALALLDGADLVIAALGYRPRALPVFGADGEAIGLLAQTGPQMPMVDGQCRVLDQDGQPVPGLFGIGLAAGFLPRGRLGGEPSFSGQANGLWLWQHDVGALIARAVAPAESGVAAETV